MFTGENVLAVQFAFGLASLACFGGACKKRRDVQRRRRSPRDAALRLRCSASGWNMAEAGTNTTNKSELSSPQRSAVAPSCSRGQETKVLMGNESVWDIGCVYNHPGPGWSARVHPAVTGSEASGSWVFLKKICEAELKWSTSGRRTVRFFSLWKQPRGEIQRASGGRGWWGGARGRGEEELCVMSVFPCLSYFEMCLNSPPSVRPVPGLRAGRSPPREPEPTGTSGGQHARLFE